MVIRINASDPFEVVLRQHLIKLMHRLAYHDEDIKAFKFRQPDISDEMVELLISDVIKR